MSHLFPITFKDDRLTMNLTRSELEDAVESDTEPELDLSILPPSLGYYVILYALLFSTVVNIFILYCSLSV